MAIRTISMNSKEFYEAVCGQPDPWRWGPGLPREPRARDPEVVVEGDCVAKATAWQYAQPGGIVD